MDVYNVPLISRPHGIQINDNLMKFRKVHLVFSIILFLFSLILAIW